MPFPSPRAAAHLLTVQISVRRHWTARLGREQETPVSCQVLTLITEKQFNELMECIEGFFQVMFFWHVVPDQEGA